MSENFYLEQLGEDRGALRATRWAESTTLTREPHEKLGAAPRANRAGETGFQKPTIEKPVDGGVIESSPESVVGGRPILAPTAISAKNPFAGRGTTGLGTRVQKVMIGRIWHGYTAPENADAYEQLLKTEILPGIAAKQVPGYRGIELLRRPLPETDEVEFVTIMRFDSWDVVRRLPAKTTSRPTFRPELERRSLDSTRGRSITRFESGWSIRSFRQEAVMIDFELEHIFSYTGRVASSPETIGPVADGMRVNFYSTGGEILGPRLRGLVRPVGGDWMTVRRDGVGRVDVRTTFESHDGAVILVTYSGAVDFGEDGYDRFLRGDLPSTAKLRISPHFATAHPAYLWLNRLHCLGIGEYQAATNEASYDVYAAR